MRDIKSEPGMPPEVAEIRDCGFAIRVNDDVAAPCGRQVRPTT